jgi:hypothetical protein
MSRATVSVRLISAAVLVLSGALTTRLVTADAQEKPASSKEYPSDDDYGYGDRLSPSERAGRDTWYFWTGGPRWHGSPKATSAF